MIWLSLAIGGVLVSGLLVLACGVALFGEIKR